MVSQPFSACNYRIRTCFIGASHHSICYQLHQVANLQKISFDWIVWNRTRSIFRKPSAHDVPCHSATIQLNDNGRNRRSASRLKAQRTIYLNRPPLCYVVSLNHFTLRFRFCVVHGATGIQHPSCLYIPRSVERLVIAVIWQNLFLARSLIEV